MSQDIGEQSSRAVPHWFFYLNMASPQKENGYTAVANELLERIVATGLNGTELAIIFLVLRKTYGYQKKQDEISLSQFCNAIPVSKKTIVTALFNLQLVKILTLVKKGSSKNCSNLWAFNKDYETWQLVKKSKLVKFSSATSVVSRPQLVKKTTHTKETNKRKYKRNTVAIATPIIKIGNEQYTMEEITYEPLDGRPNKSKYGRQTMAVLARKYAELTGTKISGTFDASEWAKPLGVIYRHFDKDVDKSMAYMEQAVNYYRSKELDFKIHTLARSIPDTERLISELENKTFNPEIYE